MHLYNKGLKMLLVKKYVNIVLGLIHNLPSDMGSNAFAFKCILNTFQKYLHLHLRFLNENYLHLKKNSNTFKYIFQIQYILQVNEFGVFLSFCKAYNLSYSFIAINVVYW